MLKGTDREKFQALAASGADRPEPRAGADRNARGLESPCSLWTASAGIVAAGLAGESPDEAVSVAETIQDPGARSWCLTDVFDKLPASARPARSSCSLRRNCRPAASSNRRKSSGSSAGSPTAGSTWVRRTAPWRCCARGVRSAKQVPPPGYEIVAFAEPLARVDLPAALALIDVAQDSAKRGDRVNRVFIFDRSYGEIAYRLASRDPAGAERVLG